MNEQYIKNKNDQMCLLLHSYDISLLLSVKLLQTKQSHVRYFMSVMSFVWHSLTLIGICAYYFQVVKFQTRTVKFTHV